MAWVEGGKGGILFYGRDIFKFRLYAETGSRKRRYSMKPLLALAAVALLYYPLGVQAMSAEEVVAKHCVACHEAGLGGAPKMDDREAWAPRIATGIDAMA